MPNGSDQPLETPGGAGGPNPNAIAQFIQQMMQRQQQQSQGDSGPRASLVSPGLSGLSLGAPQLPTAGGMGSPSQPPVGGQPPTPGATMRTMTPNPSGPQPSMTAASYGGPATTVVPPPEGGPYNFPNKSARNMAVTQSAVKGLLDGVTALKQKKWTEEAARTEQAASGYVTLLQKAEEEQDPQKKQQLLQLAEQMKSDKTVAKLLEKAHKDPMSGAAIGLQRAMQTSMAKESQSAAIEKLRADATKAYADAQKAQMEGQANAQKAQAEAAKLQQETANLDPAAMRKRAQEKHEADMQKTKAVESAKTQRTQETVKGAMERNKNTVNAMRDIANARTAMMGKIAGMKQTGKGGSKAIDYFDKEYKNIQAGVNNLTVEHKALQDHIDKQGTIGRWWNSADVQVTQNKIALNEARAAQLKQRLDEIDKNRALALSMGELPAMPPDDGPVNAEETSDDPQGTEDDPIPVP